MHWWWSGDGLGGREEVRLLAPFLVFRAPGSIGSRWVVAGATPVPLAPIAQEYIHSQRFLNPEGNFMSPGRLHL